MSEPFHSLQVNLPADVKAWLQSEAQRQGITMKALVVTLIERERAIQSLDELSEAIRKA